MVPLLHGNCCAGVGGNGAVQFYDLEKEAKHMLMKTLNALRGKFQQEKSRYLQKFQVEGVVDKRHCRLALEVNQCLEFGAVDSKWVA